MKKQRKTLSKIFKIFKGSYVSVITKSIRGSQISTEGRINGNAVMSGVLIDEDGEFYFLSENGQDITDAIKKDDVVRIFFNLEELNGIINDMGSNGEAH